MIPCAPAGQRLYAIGDIHGRLDLMQQLLTRITADSPQPAQLIFLGDFIDRGLNSKGVLETLISLPNKPIFILGNHDQVLRDILRDGDTSLARDWLSFGGREAALSYGVTPPMLLVEKNLAAFVAALQAAVPQPHKDFLNSLQTHVVFGDYFFCHAGVRPGVALDKQTEDDMAWIRADFMPHTGDYGKVIVHGHTVRQAPDIHTNRIGIDTGAYATGNLTALGLEGTRQWFLHTA